MTKSWYEAQPKEKVAKCNLCGGLSFAEMADTDRYGFPVTTALCRDCGLIFLNPRMTREAYTKFYRDGVYRQLLSKFYGRPITPETIQGEQEDYAERLEELLSIYLYDRNSQEHYTTLLDVGGSTGVVAAHLARIFGLEATVLEPSVAEARKAAEKGCTVILGTLEDHEPDGEKYDVVTLCQTVDHLIDISGSLTVIRALLEDDGLFFVDFVAGGPLKIDHPYYLTQKTMRDYLERAGFVVMEQRPSLDKLHIDMLCEAA